MADEAKRKALTFLLLALVMTALIGTGLPRLKFQPGMPLPSLQDGQVVAPPPSVGEAAVGVSVNTFFVILILATLAVYLLIQFYRLVKGVNWKKLLSETFSYFFKFLVVIGILSLVFSRLPKSEESFYIEPIPTPKPVITAPLGPVPPSLIWLVTIGLVVSAAILGLWMIGSKRCAAPDLWKLEVEKARQKLLAGQDFRNVILGCYQRMSLALQQEQKIEREAFMTTGEFERLLTTKGVPPEPVHRLTQLFEAVRYGHWQPDAGDEGRAVDCLEAILKYSHEARGES